MSFDNEAYTILVATYPYDIMLSVAIKLALFVHVVIKISSSFA